MFNKNKIKWAWAFAWRMPFLIVGAILTVMLAIVLSVLTLSIKEGVGYWKEFVGLSR